MATFLCQQDGDLCLPADNEASAWYNGTAPTDPGDVIDINGKNVFNSVEYDHSTWLMIDGQATGSVEMRASLKLFSITDVPITIIAGATLYDPRLLSGDLTYTADKGTGAYIAVNAGAFWSHTGAVAATDVSATIINNSGTLVSWEGSATLSPHGSITQTFINNSGTIASWAGDIEAASDVIVLNNTGTVDAWYGRVTAGSATAIINDATGVITMWTGDLTATNDSCFLSNAGTVTQWDGNVYGFIGMSGKYVVSNAITGTIAMWNGDVYSYSSGNCVENLGTITTWNGNIVNDSGASVAVLNSGTIGTWTGDITGYGLNNAGKISAWNGDVNACYSGYGVYCQYASIIDAWNGDITCNAENCIAFTNNGVITTGTGKLTLTKASSTIFVNIGVVYSWLGDIVINVPDWPESAGFTIGLEITVNGFVEQWQGDIAVTSVVAVTVGVLHSGTVQTWLGNIHASIDCYGLYLNAGTITLWKGNVTANLGKGVIVNGGSIIQWFGNVSAIDTTGLDLAACTVDNWYGDIYTSGVSSVGCYLNSGGRINAWYGNIVATTVGAGIQMTGSSQLIAYYGNVNATGGAAGIYVDYDSTLVAFHGSVNVTGATGVDLDGNIIYWYGDICATHDDGVYVTNGIAIDTMAKIHEGVGDVICKADGVGINNFGTITRWFGNIDVSDGVVGNTAVYSGGSISLWYGNINVVDAGIGINYEGPTPLQWVGNINVLDNASDIDVIGIFNEGTISFGQGNITASGDHAIGLYSVTTIDNWHGNISATSGASGIKNSGTITAGYGDVLAGMGSFGINTQEGSYVTVWMGDAYGSAADVAGGFPATITDWIEWTTSVNPLGLVGGAHVGDAADRNLADTFLSTMDGYLLLSRQAKATAWNKGIARTPIPPPFYVPDTYATPDGPAAPCASDLVDTAYVVMDIPRWSQDPVTGTFNEALRNTNPGEANVKAGVTYFLAGEQYTGTGTGIPNRPIIISMG